MILPKFACDFETLLIRPGWQAPPPVCLSWADEESSGLVPTAELRDAFVALLEEGIVGHNIAYDAAVAATWLDVQAELIAAYEAGRVLDTMIFERIAEIGQFTGRKVLSLDVCCAAYGIQVTKAPTAAPNVRLSYGSVFLLPLEAYTPEQTSYAIEDSVATWKLFERQRERHELVRLEDVALLTAKSLWLQVTRNRGLRTSAGRIDQLRRETVADIEELAQFGREMGFLRADGTRDMAAIKEAIFEAYGGKPPMTEGGKKGPTIKTARSVLEESGDPNLERWAEYGENLSTLNVLADDGRPSLATGIAEPIHTKWGIADTTRTTSSKPNVQNIRRREGLRECFEPRPGYCFIEADHSGLEQVCLAQVCVTNLGLRALADKLNSGVDTHLEIAAAILKVSDAEAIALRKAKDPKVDHPRQCGKVVNYGRAGFMGAKTLKFYAKQSYQLDLDLPFCEELIAIWEQRNPDGAAFLEWITRFPEAAGVREMTIPGTGILRRGCTISACANSHFQGLGAVVEAVTGWEVLKATWGSGALGQCHLVNFVHDSFMLECPPALCEEALDELLGIMRTAPRHLLPDVKIDAEGEAMWQWSKKAKLTRDSAGRLIPWGTPPEQTNP